MTRPSGCTALKAGALVREAARLLAGRNPGAARLEAEVLLAFVLGLDRTGLYVRWNETLPPGSRQAFARLVERRVKGEPVAYLTGEREFMSLPFRVTPDVLIPRPETELMVETALSLLRQAGPTPRAADVGTGSGAIAVSLAVYCPQVRLQAVDISEAALAVARQNAVRHKVTGRISFTRGDLLADVDGPVDLVAANLPYIPTGELDRLPSEVRAEPRLALDGGPDGLDPYRRLVPQAACLVRQGGWLLAEIGPRQAAAVLTLAGPPLWRARVAKDLAGRPRLLLARRMGRLDTGRAGNI